MNILIIDDGLLPFYESKSPNKKAVFQCALENTRLNRELAKAFSALSNNVLLITSSEESTLLPKHFFIAQIFGIRKAVGTKFGSFGGSF